MESAVFVTEIHVVRVLCLQYHRLSSQKGLDPKFSSVIGKNCGTLKKRLNFLSFSFVPCIVANFTYLH
jgi:hypothetical protein